MLLDVAADGANERGLRVSVDGLGAAAQACAITGLLGLERMSEELYVFSARALRGARGTAEDSRAGDGKDEGAVERSVAIENRTPATGIDLGIDQVNSSPRLARLYSFRSCLWSSGHRSYFCFYFCKYRIGGHADNIGQLHVRGLSECCGQTKFLRASGGWAIMAWLVSLLKKCRGLHPRAQANSAVAS